ncbi:MAG: hypothetical protein QM845_17025 [Verrucomicrobiota bacterium]|nr:hypothetical protein [Verrucomicrobiota bacterium]
MSVKRNVFVALAFAAVAVAAIAVLVHPSGQKGAALGGRQREMETLGAQIAKLRPHSKVLVLSNPFAKESGFLNEKSRYERVGLRGLTKGLGGGSTVKVVFPEIRPEYFTNPQSVIIPPDSPTPLSFLMQPDSVDRLAATHPECHVIVSLIGLPAEVQSLRIWDEKDPRCLALLMPDLRLIGGPSDVVAAFRRGKLLAAVFEDGQSGDPLIVTKDNVAQIFEQRPQVLGF